MICHISLHRVGFKSCFEFKKCPYRHVEFRGPPPLLLQGSHFLMHGQLETRWPQPEPRGMPGRQEERKGRGDFVVGRVGAWR